MKIYKLFIIAVAACTFAACSNDGNNDIDPVVDNGAPTRATVSITQTSSSYAPPGNASVPTADESKINTAKVYVFNANRILEQTVDLTVTGNTTASKTFLTTTGTHYFYAVINIPSSSVSGITEGMALGTFESKLMDIASTSDMTNTTDGFWMTNVERPSGVNLVEATEAEANSGTNNIVIPVGRTSVKVNLEFAPTEQLYGELTDVTYKVNNNPVQMYFMPNFSNGYLISPFFDQSIVTSSNYFDQTAFISEGTTTYSVENANKTPKQGNATYVSIKGTFTPEVWRDSQGDVNNTPASPGDTFWRIANLDNGVIVDFEDEYYSAEPDSSLIGSNQKPVEYQQDVSYYGLYLAKTSLTDITAKYTVARNSYYWITITSVSGAGYPDDGGNIVDPEIPIETDTYMKAIIEVLPWTLYEQNGGI